MPVNIETLSPSGGRAWNVCRMFAVPLAGIDGADGAAKCFAIAATILFNR